MTWTGPCKDLFADGQGTLVWRCGGREERYVGPMRDGKAHGRGTRAFLDGVCRPVGPRLPAHGGTAGRGLGRRARRLPLRQHRFSASWCAVENAQRGFLGEPP